MTIKKQEKDIADMITQRHAHAISEARSGKYLELIKVCLECLKAENKALRAAELGAVNWGFKTAEYYRKIRWYLESFFTNSGLWDEYQKLVKGIDDGTT